jgi:hypothetical protein
MRQRFVRVTLAASLFVTPVWLMACDREDRKDVKEGVKEVEREIDELDSEGKDD